MTEYTQEDVDSVVPERHKGKSFKDLAPGLQNFVAMRLQKEPSSEG